MDFIVYDIEVYPNVFTIALKYGDCEWWFEISDRKDQKYNLLQLLNWVKSAGLSMVGFNNYGFDYPVLHFLINNNPSPFQIYCFSHTVITSEDKFKYIIWDKDQYIPQIDLFKIHHFDNKAKATSLKMIEFNMRSQDIQDLPYKPGTVLNSYQIDELIKYNRHDVRETEKFLHESKSEIAFRQELSKKYDRNFMNHNDTKIGKDYFLMKLEELNPGCTKINGQPRQTPRQTINIGEIIFPYIKFNRSELQAVHSWLSSRVITETKGALTDITEYELGSLAHYCYTVRKRKKGILSIPLSTVEYTKSGKPYTCYNVAPTLNCIADGFQFDFGTGGLHGSVESQLVVSDTNSVIIDVDVKAYYPSHGIKNGLYPEHLGSVYCKIAQDVLDERDKHKKGTTENKMMKLANNGTFGETNNKFSSFYDPQYTMSITINGQLLLCMLAEKLMEIPGLQMIQANTDGITAKCPRQYKEWFMSICKWWEQFTCLQLEYVEYTRMWIRDVNNYVAESYKDGKPKLKQKGAYETERAWHKNHSMLVVPKAAVKVLSEDTSVQDAVLSHNDPMDFLLRTKVQRTGHLLYGNEQVQNITRYYISNNGKPLTKMLPPIESKPNKWRPIGINTGYNTTVCNEWSGSLQDVNYDFYIEEVKKLVNPVILNKGV